MEKSKKVATNDEKKTTTRATVSPGRIRPGDSGVSTGGAKKSPAIISPGRVRAGSSSATSKPTETKKITTKSSSTAKTPMGKKQISASASPSTARVQTRQKAPISSGRAKVSTPPARTGGGSPAPPEGRQDTEAFVDKQQHDEGSSPSPLPPTSFLARLNLDALQSIMEFVSHPQLRTLRLVNKHWKTVIVPKVCGVNLRAYQVQSICNVKELEEHARSLGVLANAEAESQQQQQQQQQQLIVLALEGHLDDRDRPRKYCPRDEDLENERKAFLAAIQRNNISADVMQRAKELFPPDIQRSHRVLGFRIGVGNRTGATLRDFVDLFAHFQIEYLDDHGNILGALLRGIDPQVEELRQAQRPIRYGGLSLLVADDDDENDANTTEAANSPPAPSLDEIKNALRNVREYHCGDATDAELIAAIPQLMPQLELLDLSREKFTVYHDWNSPNAPEPNWAEVIVKANPHLLRTIPREEAIAVQNSTLAVIAKDDPTEDKIHFVDPLVFPKVVDVHFCTRPSSIPLALVQCPSATSVTMPLAWLSVGPVLLQKSTDHLKSAFPVLKHVTIPRNTRVFSSLLQPVLEQPHVETFVWHSSRDAEGPLFGAPWEAGRFVPNPSVRSIRLGKHDDVKTSMLELLPSNDFFPNLKYVQLHLVGKKLGTVKVKEELRKVQKKVKAKYGCVLALSWSEW